MATMAHGKARLEARIDPELDDLIVEAALRLNVTKTAIVSHAVREAALTVIARTEMTRMVPDAFDAMIAAVDVGDEFPELEDLAQLPRVLTR